MVNGPGEARAADAGIAGGDGVGLLFRHGEIGRKSSGLLVKISDQNIEPQAAGAFYRRQQSGGRFQKSRLSGTVGTDDTDLLSASNSQG